MSCWVVSVTNDHVCRHICTLRWRHNERDSVSNHQPRDCLLNRLFRRRSKKTSKLRVTVLCVGNSPGTGEFPAQMASNAENVSIWWRHHATPKLTPGIYSSHWVCCWIIKISVPMFKCPQPLWQILQLEAKFWVLVCDHKCITVTWLQGVSIHRLLDFLQACSGWQQMND